MAPENLADDSPSIVILSGLEDTLPRMEGENSLRSPERAMLVITHYQRLLNYIEPDFVHVLSDGRIVRSGDRSLALELEEKGYGWIEEEAAAVAGARS